MAFQGEPQGCLFHNPYRPAAQETSKFRLPGKSLPVQLSPIRVDIGTLGLYQDPQAGSSSPPGAESEDGGLHRRHADPCGDQGSNTKPGRRSGLSPRGHGVHQIINQKKLILGLTQSIDFLGLMIDTRSMIISLPAEKLKKNCAEVRMMAQGLSVLARDLARLLGKIDATACVLPVAPVLARDLARLLGRMNATACVLPVAPLFCCHLQRSLSQALNDSAQSYETQVALSPESREELTHTS